MSKINVQLSRQDLGDFLEDNENWMEQYRAELQRRLVVLGWATDVEISDVLSDNIIADDEDQAKEVVGAVMAQMGNDWDWLKQ